MRSDEIFSRNSVLTTHKIIVAAEIQVKLRRVPPCLSLSRPTRSPATPFLLIFCLWEKPRVFINYPTTLSHPFNECTLHTSLHWQYPLIKLEGYDNPFRLIYSHCIPSRPMTRWCCSLNPYPTLFLFSLWKFNFLCRPNSRQPKYRSTKTPVYKNAHKA